MEFDSADKKVLTALFENSRQPLSVIAKKNGLSREIVEYRVEKLVEKGIIKSFIAVIDQAMFGAGVAQLLLKVSRNDTKAFEDVLAAISRHPSVNWVAELCGVNDIVLTFFYANAEDLSQTVTDIVRLVGSLFLAQELQLYITQRKYDLLGLVNPTHASVSPEITFGGQVPVVLDEKDVLLLRALVQHCRPKAAVLAKQVNLSEDGVRERIKKLERQRVILGYTIVLDAAACEYGYYYVRLQMDNVGDDIINKLSYYVRASPYITFAAQSVGHFNFVLSIAAHSQKHFIELLLDLRHHFGTVLSNYEFQLLVRECKAVYIPERFLRLDVT